MGILSKHKKNGVEGFKHFAQNLETAQGKAFENIVQLALLEDPVYMKWVIPNMMNYTYIMKCNSDHVSKIAEQLHNAPKMFVVCFFDSDLEEKFVEDKLDRRMRRDYMDEKELVKSVTESQKEDVRNQIVQIIRKLQNSYDIPAFKWTLPPNNIMDGSNQQIKPNSVFKLNFENGKPALVGKTKGKQRNGIWQHFYPNGNPMAIGEYARGVKTGDWKFFYANRTLKSEGKYVNDNKEGEWTEYDKEGTAHKAIYKNGKKAE